MMRRLRENLLSSLVALTVAAPMSYVMQLSLGMRYSGWFLLLFAAVSLLLLDLASLNRVTAIAVPCGAVLLGLAVWGAAGAQGRQAIQNFFVWAFHFLGGGWTYTFGFGLVLTAMVTFLTTALVWLLGRKFFCFPALCVATVGFFLFKWMSGMDSVLVPGMLACGGLILLWAKSFQRRTAKKTVKATPENGMALTLLPLAALIVLISLTVASDENAKSWQSRGVHDAFQRVNNFLADYTQFNRPRNAFTIGTYGLMPMGSRLGGPVHLADVDVMRVDAPRRMLLRGTIYNNYTGTLWTNTLEKTRSRFIGDRDAARDEAFGLDKPGLSGSAASDFNQFVTAITVRVHPIVNCPSTLFIPYRGVRSITSDNFLAVLPYYNAAGEAFSSSDVLAGYGYTVKVEYVNYTAPGFNAEMESLMAMRLQDTPEREQYIRQNYLALPEGIEKTVYDLTDQIVSGVSITQGTATDNGKIVETNFTQLVPSPIHNDYDKALAIKKYLTNTCTYTLSPGVPPEKMDFVSYFVSHDPQGYCTYFASAMAVMARIAGIPSRYVEGYLMPGKASGDPMYTLNGKNAHAWAELYFEGIGWIPFDATPVGDGIGETNGSNIGTGYPIPTPPPQVDATTTDIPFTLQTGLDWGKIVAWLWTLPCVLLICFILWISWSMIKAKTKVSLGNVRKRYADVRLQCAFYYAELLRLLEEYDRPVMQGETPYAFAERVDRWLQLGAGRFETVASLISLLSYSEYEPLPEDAAFMARYYNDLARYTRKTVGLPQYLWRHVLGFSRKEVSRRRFRRPKGG